MTLGLARLPRDRAPVDGVRRGTTCRVAAVPRLHYCDEVDSLWFAEATKNSVMGMAARELAWDQTPLGRPSTWHPALRQAVQLCFSTTFPMMIAWGPEHTMIYNDGYRDMLGTDKRLNAMGRPSKEVWAEIWDYVGGLFAEVEETGQSTGALDQPLLMNRSGFEEETNFTFSYSPITDETGTVLGILNITSETTASVVDRRRLQTIDQLHAAMTDHRADIDALADAVLHVLRESADIAGAELHLTEGGDLVLAGRTHHDRGSLAAPHVVHKAWSSRTPVSSRPTLVAPLARAEDAIARGVLVLEGNPRRPYDAAQRSFLMLVASSVSAALGAATDLRREIDLLDAHAELIARDAERSRESSVTLQHSLLTAPPEPDHLHIVVRYHPASDHLEIGGDWYDSFMTEDGSTMIVIGDVTGHDHHAAAAMGQIRGIIRAIAYDRGEVPSRVLTRADNAIHGLNLGQNATASAIVARIEQDHCDLKDRTRTIRWSNAGHPPPVILRADGSVEVLRRQNDLILGIIPDHDRHDFTITLNDNDTLLFYTDGLIERRNRTMTASVEALVSTLEGRQDEDLDGLCEHVLRTLVPSRAEDDIALVVVRAYPQDQPRPAEAGPNRNIPPELDDSGTADAEE